MKNLSLFICTAATAFALQACNSSTKSSTDVAADSNAKKDTSDMKSSVDTTAKVAGAVMKTDKDDADFAVKAANGGMAEVQIAQLAQQKAESADVKDFAAKMITDHTKANEKLLALAKQKNITLPAALGNDEQKILNDLSKKSGKDFDKAYVKAMVKDHEEDVKVFTDEAKDAKDADLKAYAGTTLPTLKMHESMIKAIDKKMN